MNKDHVRKALEGHLSDPDDSGMDLRSALIAHEVPTIPGEDMVTAAKRMLETSEITGWTVGDGSGNEGYCVSDYFAADGRYLGPDEHGIEPIFAEGAR